MEHCRNDAKRIQKKMRIHFLRMSLARFKRPIQSHPSMHFNPNLLQVSVFHSFQAEFQWWFQVEMIASEWLTSFERIIPIGWRRLILRRCADLPGVFSTCWMSRCGRRRGKHHSSMARPCNAFTYVWGMPNVRTNVGSCCYGYFHGL